MIVVVADDLTGAAELAGIGLRFGLTTTVSMILETDTKTDLLVIAADTRSKEEKRAAAEMGVIARRLRQLQPDWIYKKVDSVLRGHIVAEINSQLAELGWPRALLIPANPSLGRTIRDGHYFLQGVPVDQTSFSADPEFAIGSSDIQKMLRFEVAVRKPGEELPATGIIVGEVSTEEDLATWTGRIGENMLAAGGSGFFAALLTAAGLRRTGGVPAEPSFGAPVLFVSGTTFGDNRERIRRLHADGGPVRYMDNYNWVGEAAALLRESGKAVVGIGDVEQGAAAATLRTAMAEGVYRIIRGANVRELVIEGGATAYAILQRLGLYHFYPVEELAPGVVRMRAADLFITVKPGSYRWPETIKY